MPSRGSYQIARVGEGKAAERDESYKSCIATLLIFLFLIIIFIVAGLLWKKPNTYYPTEEDTYVGTAQHHHHEHEVEHHTKRTTTTTTIKYYLDPTISSVDESNSSSADESTSSSVDVSNSSSADETSSSSVNKSTSSSVDESNSSSADETTSSSVNKSNSSSVDESTSSSADETTSSSVNESNSFSVDKSEKLETTLPFEVSTQEYDVVTITSRNYDYASKFEKLLNAETTTENISTIVTTNNESTIEKQLYDDSTIDSFVESNNTLTSTTEEYEVSSIDQFKIDTTEAPTSTDSNSISEETSFGKYETTTYNNVTENEENVTMESTTESFRNSVTQFTTLSMMKHTTMSEPIITSTNSPNNKQICESGECKNLASKILFYMNHTMTDPCDDFYEYACGGFEANPQTIDRNLEDVAYQRILRQMQLENYEGKSTLFSKYYNSCIQYENVNITERIKLAKKELDRVGKFYTTSSWAKHHTNFTELLAKLLLNNRALLFDVTPDLDEYSPKQFTLKIGPTMNNNPFNANKFNTDDPCYASQFEREKEEVNLNQLYTDYETCKKNTQEYIKSIQEALETFDVFNELNNSYNISQYIKLTYISIDLEIVQKFFANFPSTDKIHETYLMKNYTLVSIEELEKNFPIINWSQLIYNLTKEVIVPKTKAMLLHNALLGLYARNLYHELVLSKHRDIERQCIHVAANLLISEASNLYISSFSKDQLTHMNKTIYSLFGKLKETLKLKIKEVEWPTKEGRNALIAKIDSLKVVVPDISYFTDGKSTYMINKASEVNLSDNYFENTVTLMQMYRKLIYAEFFTNPDYPEQIWTHYATPYQSKGLAIYGLNLVIIPFGVIDWSMNYDEHLFDYITLATLGNVIAHQIAHHFDANGIYYWNGTRDAKNSLLHDNNSTYMNFKEYINNQRSVFDKNLISMTLASTGQTVHYEISQLTLNERLSETMGLRLAYDTLDRLRSPEEVHLPWLELNVEQLFYLTYAQMHCTKTPLTSSYISLYENEQLPSRIRIFVSAFNNRLVGEAWNCPEGSRIMPSYSCSAFPYLQCNETTETAEAMEVTMMRK
ncbi:PREDICTED: neprilysin-2-like [Habropoda laboriosa]|uniref:neprilysin-2-like n=1 Tax=Habropoda laboriosa TaxID=597456 RepID=UPI00083E62D0|nr:PREDICTED: neprilysin-2-like [Habropoda laboriosa]